MADQTESFTANQQYFDKIASEYDSRFGKTLDRLEDEVKKAKDFIGMKSGGRMLDYACGTGMLSRTIGLDASECVGVDISENMVGAYNAKANDLYPSKRHAHVGNLLSPSDPSPSALSDPTFQNFDLAGVGAGFHHFDDPKLAAKRLAERLRPGGVLFILDFKPHLPKGDLKHKGVTHHGFGEEEVRRMFVEAGVGGDFAFMETSEPVVFHDVKGGNDFTREVFMARGTKI